MDRVPIIAVTGTKGKTTTVAVIADVLKQLGNNTLKVDTTGHFVNGFRKSTLEDSKKIWNIVPSKAPGRYLWEFHVNPELQENGVAVLECSLGCSGPVGLGYQTHHVGVFLNVFEDHLGSNDKLKTRDDIAKAKRFVFAELSRDESYAVFNADDHRVVATLDDCWDEDRGITKIPIGLTFEFFDVETHIANGGVAITVNNAGDKIIMKSKGSEIILADMTKIPWAFDGKFLPSVWNIMAACGAIYGHYHGQLPDNFRAAMENVRLDKDGGRLTVLKAKNNAMIIADYAHEKVSLATIAKLAHEKVGKDGRVIGVVRMAYDRTDDIFYETGRVIGESFDDVIVYDKIDGHWRQPLVRGINVKFAQVVGKVSEKVANATREVNDNVHRIIREDEAVKYAAEIAKPNDVVVVIVNDDIKRSIDFIQDAFQAEFV
jgi:cyanophycin synthetase